MALSGSVTTGAYTTSSGKTRSLTLEWTATQNVGENTSTVSWTLKGSGTLTGDSYVTLNQVRVTIDGTEVFYKGYKPSLHCLIDTEVASGSVVLLHENDGVRSFDVLVEAALYYFTIEESIEKNSTIGSESFVLTAIPRASTIITASNVTLGNSCGITWEPKSKNFYYKIKFVLGNWNYTTSSIHPNTTNSFTYTGYMIPLDAARQLPQSETGTMTVYLYSYSASDCLEQIGDVSSKTFTVTVPVNIIPTINNMSISVINDNSVVDGWDVYLKGYSKARVNCSASGAYGSTISNYVLSGGYSEVVTSMPYTGGAISSSGDVTFNCYVKDSRGRNSNPYSSTITVYDYYKPYIDRCLIQRKTDDDEKILIRVSYNYSSIDNKNSASAILYYKESTSSSWTEYGTISNNVPTTLNGSFDNLLSYNFRIVVTDSLSQSAEVVENVSTTTVLMDFRAGGKGLGIGKICESDALEVGMVSKFINDIYITDSSGELITLEQYIKNIVNSM